MQLGRAQEKPGPSTAPPWLWLCAGVVVLAHLLTNARYGFHRDELQVLSDALHLDWGFVPYPPFTPVIERVGLALFGLSVLWLRVFSVLAQAVVILATGWMARELGGGRRAQLAAALAVALSPLPLFEGTEFQYTSFDELWWVLSAYFVVRLLKTDNPRWWLAIGGVMGLGMLTKYTIFFFAAGIAGGLLLTPARRFLRSPWLWAGVLLALLMFLPNLLWQVRHDFISLRFLHAIHARDVGEGRAEGFFRDQALLCTNPFAVPLWLAGLYAYLRDARYRMLAWMYLIPLALLAAGQGRGYYLGAVYPMLIAMGSVQAARWLANRSRRWRWALIAVFFAGLFGYATAAATVVLPLASRGALMKFALAHNGDLREEIGWEEMVRNVARIRDSLPPAQRAGVGVLVGNYGEQGAIEIFGPRYGLPAPISRTNTAWLRGYPTSPPSTLIVLGDSREWVMQHLTGCRLAGRNGNGDGVQNEESRDHPDIFICGPPRQPWPAFWRSDQRFG
jgi:4-amino-4-deoxy-L-arabinose transferase-like glycosyltransferase